MVQSAARRSILGSIANENRQIMSSGCSCGDSEATTPEPFEAGCDCDYTPHDAERAACGTGGCAVPTSPSSRTVQHSSTTVTGGLSGMSAASGQAQTALVDMYAHDAGSDNTSGADYGMIDGALDETMGADQDGTHDILWEHHDEYCEVLVDWPPSGINKHEEWDEYEDYWRGGTSGAACFPRGLVGPGAEVASRHPLIMFEVLSYCYMETFAYLASAGYPVNANYNFVYFAWFGPHWTDLDGREHVQIIDAMCGLALDGDWAWDSNFMGEPQPKGWKTLVEVEDPPMGGLVIGTDGTAAPSDPTTERPPSWFSTVPGPPGTIGTTGQHDPTGVGGFGGSDSAPSGNPADWDSTDWDTWYDGLDDTERATFNKNSENAFNIATGTPEEQAAFQKYIDEVDCTTMTDQSTQSYCASAFFVDENVNGPDNLFDPDGGNDPCGPPDWARC